MGFDCCLTQHILGDECPSLDMTFRGKNNIPAGMHVVLCSIINLLLLEVSVPQRPSDIR